MSARKHFKTIKIVLLAVAIIMAAGTLGAGAKIAYDMYPKIFLSALLTVCLCLGYSVVYHNQEDT